MNDEMATATTIPDTPSVPHQAIHADNPGTRLRTLSTTTQCQIVWTPGLILRRILERKRAGLSLKAAAVQRESISLWAAARRHFGSWDRAMAKAHKAASGRIVTHTRDSIIARLLEHAATGLPMSTTYPLTKSCYKPAVRLFGSWIAAVKAAGLEPRGGSRDYSREQILDILKERWRTGKSVSSCHPDMQPYVAVTQRLFGSWTKAREEAGCGRPMPFARDEVLAALVTAFDGERNPHMRDTDLRPYVPAACRIFGKWREAVRQAKKQWSEKMQSSPSRDHDGAGER